MLLRNKRYHYYSSKTILTPHVTCHVQVRLTCAISVELRELKLTWDKAQHAAENRAK